MNIDSPAILEHKQKIRKYFICSSVLEKSLFTFNTLIFQIVYWKTKLPSKSTWLCPSIFSTQATNFERLIIFGRSERYIKIFLNRFSQEGITTWACLQVNSVSVRQSFSHSTLVWTPLSSLSSKPSRNPPKTRSNDQRRSPQVAWKFWTGNRENIWMKSELGSSRNDYLQCSKLFQSNLS